MNSQEYVYLDYAASTPVDARVAEHVAEIAGRHYANPSSLHSPGREARKALEASRKKISSILGAKPREIIFISGSTEGVNMAILGVLRANPGSTIVTSQLEHEAVLESVAQAALEGHPASIVDVSSDGVLKAADVAEKITDTTVLVSIMQVNNEIGTVQPIAKIAATVAQIRRDRQERGIDLPLYLHSDSAQAGLQNLTVDSLGVDLMSMGGSKIYGPHGSGFLYVRTGTRLRSLFYGGGHEGGLRSGTPDVASAAGLAMALETAQLTRAAERSRLRDMRDLLVGKIADIPGISFHYRAFNSSPHIISCSIAGLDGESLVAYLDAAGFGVATGSACTASDSRPSHVLRAIGISDELATGSLRISIGRPTTHAHIELFAAALEKVVLRLRGIATDSNHR